MATRAFDFIARLGFQTTGKGSLQSFQSAITGLGKTMVAATAAGAAMVAGATVLARKISQQRAVFHSTAEAMEVNGKVLDDLGYAFGEVGMSGEDFLKMFERMNRTVGENAEKTRKYVEEMGYSWEEFKKSTPEQQFYAISDALVAMDDAQRAAHISQALLGRNTAKYVGALKKTGKSTKDVVEWQEQYNHENRESIEAARKFTAQMDLLSQQTETLKNKFFSLLGGALTPFVEKLNEWLVANKDVIDSKFNKWMDKLGKSIENVMNFLSDSNKMEEFKNQIYAGIDALKKLAKVAAWIIGTVAALNAIIFASKAIKAIVSLAKGLFKVFRGIFKVVRFLIPWILRGFTLLGKGILTALSSPFVILGAIIIASWGYVVKTIYDNWGFLKSEFFDALDKIGKWFSETWLSIKVSFYKAFYAVQTFFATTWESIKSTFSSVWDGISTYFFAGIETIKSAFSSAWTWIVDKFLIAWEPVKTFLQTLYDTLVKPIIEGIKWIQGKDDAGDKSSSAGSNPSPLSSPVFQRGASQSFSSVVDQTRNQYSQTTQNTINITGSPGMDSRQLAREIGRELDKRTHYAAGQLATGVAR